jgi:23S rRNA pseudouridine2605 synthase
MNKKKISKGFSPYSRKKDSASPYRKPAPKTGIPKPIGTKQQSTKIDNEDGLIRLNKFIANSGVCSRREADILISGGSVTVNGKIITELGTKVKPTDVVLYNGEKLKAEKKVYVLLNKPKDYITTATDPQGRKTVMDLIKNAGNQRLFPVGRLDRNTTGLLLLTNDGELTKKLTHPKHGVRKLYHVLLDKPLTKADMDRVMDGIEIEGEKIVPDEVAYTGRDGNKTNVGIELHSGQNRVVRRIFESLDYKVMKLDRVTFAGLTKKDLPRGHWRFLTEKEVSFLMMIR